MARGYRKRFMFWLDIENDSDFQIAELIMTLKHERKFAQTIRDGIRLVCDLRAGKVEVLTELFPDVVAKLSKSNPPSTPDSGDLKREITALKQLVISQNTNIPANGLVNAPRNGNVKSAADDVPDIVLKRDTSTDSAKNFLNSMMSLQG